MNFLKLLARDWTFLGLVVVSLAMVLSVTLGRLALTEAVIGILLTLWIVVLVLLYFRLLDVRQDVTALRIIAENARVSEEVQVISMTDFIHRESRLGAGDSVLLFANTLDYDRRYFTETIAQNLKRGVRYYYLMGGVKARRTWEQFLSDLKEKGATRFPEGRFNTLDITPLLWTTAVYEYKDPDREVEAISILEHQYDSNACIELTGSISRRMREHFWDFWHQLSDLDVG